MAREDSTTAFDDIAPNLAELPDGWQYVPLSKLVDEGRGISYGIVQPGGQVSDGIPIVRVQDIKEGRIDETSPLRVHPEIAARYRRTQLRGGEVLLSLVGSVGQSAVAPKTVAGWNTARAVAVIPVRPEIGPQFVCYCLRTPQLQHLIRAWCTTTVQATFNLKEASLLPIPLPPPKDRKTIARILGTLDDKIELNRRMNHSLEALARALFQSWFVDFDPVTAKAAGRQPVGMSAETARLFPDTFGESPLGPIPTGWEVKSVGEVVVDVYDGPHATPPEAEHGAVFLGIKNLTGTQIDLSEIRYIGEANWPRWTRRVTPEAGDIVFTYEATLGFFALIPPKLRCCLGRRLALVRPKKEVSGPHFLFHLFISEPFQDMLIARSVTGSTVDRIPLLDFPRYTVLWPPKGIRETFERVASTVWRRIHQNESQSRNLTDLRDALLPRLLSGELRVKDVEKLAGAAP